MPDAAVLEADFFYPHETARLSGYTPSRPDTFFSFFTLHFSVVWVAAALVALGWLVVKLKAPLFHAPVVFGSGPPHGISGKDLIMIGGGLFLLFKSTREIHEKLEGEDGAVTARLRPNLAAAACSMLASRHWTLRFQPMRRWRRIFTGFCSRTIEP